MKKRQLVSIIAKREIVMSPALYKAKIISIVKLDESRVIISTNLIDVSRIKKITRLIKSRHIKRASKFTQLSIIISKIPDTYQLNEDIEVAVDNITKGQLDISYIRKLN